MRTLVTTLFVTVAATGLVLGSPSWAQLGNKTKKESIAQHVEPPAGSNLRYYIDERGTHYEYTAPPNFEEPIKVFLETILDDPNQKPDIFIWADVIHWNDTVMSATASGRIIVEGKVKGKDKYRIETTYVEYDHVNQQIYCPKRVKIIQKNPGIPDSLLEAKSALIKLDDNGIRDAKFDKLIRSYFIAPKGDNPLKKREKKAETKSESSTTETKRTVIPKKRRTFSGPAD